LGLRTPQISGFGRDPEHPVAVFRTIAIVPIWKKQP
jgi:hypothetical protein